MEKLRVLYGDSRKQLVSLFVLFFFVILFINTLMNPGWIVQPTQKSELLNHLSLSRIANVLPNTKQHYAKMNKKVDAENNESWRKVNIFCLILTSPQNLETRAKYVKESWAILCNQTLFVSDEYNATFPTIKVTNATGYDEVWAKTRKSLEYLYSKFYLKYDWFFRADDDTYVVMDNLRRFLHRKDPSKLEYYGMCL